MFNNVLLLYKDYTHQLVHNLKIDPAIEFSIAMTPKSDSSLSIDLTRFSKVEHSIIQDLNTHFIPYGEKNL